MQTVKIQTTQNIAIDYEVAGLGERMLAWLIDFGGAIVILLALEYIFKDIHIKKWDISIEILIWLGLYVFYDLVAEVFFNGQSAGKRVMKIKVVSINGARASLGQYFARWLFRIADNTMTVGLCSIISIAVTENKQRVGDIVAGTTMVKTTLRTDLESLVFRPVESDYLPVFNEVSQLSDKDMALINEVLNNFLKSANETLIRNMAGKVTGHLNITIPEGMTDYQFLQIIIKDYNSLTSFSIITN